MYWSIHTFIAESNAEQYNEKKFLGYKDRVQADLKAYHNSVLGISYLLLGYICKELLQDHQAEKAHSAGELFLKRALCTAGRYVFEAVSEVELKMLQLERGLIRQLLCVATFN